MALTIVLLSNLQELLSEPRPLLTTGKATGITYEGLPIPTGFAFPHLGRPAYHCS